MRKYYIVGLCMLLLLSLSVYAADISDDIPGTWSTDRDDYVLFYDFEVENTSIVDSGLNYASADEACISLTTSGESAISWASDFLTTNATLIVKRKMDTITAWTQIQIGDNDATWTGVSYRAYWQDDAGGIYEEQLDGAGKGNHPVIPFTANVYHNDVWFHNGTVGNSTHYVNQSSVRFGAVQSNDNNRWYDMRIVTNDAVTFCFDWMAIYSGTEAPQGAAPGPGDVIVISDLLPADGTTFNTINFSINASVGNNQSVNCSLVIDDVINNTITDIPEGPANQVIFNQTYDVSDGVSFDFYMSCINNETETNTSANTLTLDFQSPGINTAFVNNSRYYNRNLTFDVNITDNILLFRLNVTIDGASIFYQEDINDTTLNQSFNFDIKNLTRGGHNLTIFASDAHTANKIKDYKVDKGLIFHNEIKYTFPDKGYIKTYKKNGSIFDNWETYKLEDRYVQIFYPAVGDKKITFVEKSDLPIHIIKKPGHYKDEWIIIGNHWKDYVVFNNTEAKVKIKRIDTYTVEVEITKLKDENRIELHSVGDLNTNSREYVFYAENITTTYTEFLINNFATTYTLNLFNPGNGTPNVVLEINESFNLTPEANTINPDQYVYTINTNVNISTFGIGNITHRWYFNLSGPENDFTDDLNQTVINITIGTCAGSNTFPILNMSYFETQAFASINLTNNYDLSFTDGTNVYNVQGTFTDNYFDTFCTNLDPDVNVFVWDMSGEMTLTKPLYATNLYEIDSGSPLQVSNEPVEDLSLFMSLLNETTTVDYRWFTTDFQNINGIMEVYQCNGNGTENLIQSVPIIEANANANIELFDIPYRYEVVIDGQRFTNYDGFSKCHVESQETITYYVDVRQLDLEENIGMYSILCTLNKIGSNVVNMTWGNNPDNTVDDITGCIVAYRSSVLGVTQVYENCTSSANSLLRTIPITGYDYYVSGTLTQAGQIVYCSQTLDFSTGSAADELIGISGLLAAFFIAAAMALIFTQNGEYSLIALSIGLVAVWMFGFVQLTWVTVGSMLGFVVILLFIGRYVRKR